MPARVSPTDRVRAKIDELFASDRELPEILEEVARLGAQLLMQAALEAEVTEFLGRDRYQRTAAAPDAQPGSRNGYRSEKVKTTAGPVTLERLKLRGTTAAFASDGARGLIAAIARPRIAWLARTNHDPRRTAPAPRPSPRPAAPAPTTTDPARLRARHPQHRNCQRYRVTSPTEARTCARPFTPESGRHPDVRLINGDDDHRWQAIRGPQGDPLSNAPR